MLEPLKKISITSKGLRYKLIIMFCLMAIIPLLVCGYLMRDLIVPPHSDILSIGLILFFTMTIAMLGLIFARRMIYPVIDMSIEAKMIATGDFERKIKISQEDEIGDLGNSINMITSHIKNNMEELRRYGERTKEINIEIHKKVLSLSNLLQIGELIAQTSNLDDVLNIILEKIAQVDENGFAAFYLLNDNDKFYFLKASYELNLDKLKDLKIRLGENFFGNLLIEKKVIVFDSSVKITRNLQNVSREYDLKNFILVPIVTRQKLSGFIISGNYDGSDFKFKDDDLEVIKIFSKQVALAVENQSLSERVKALAIVDDLTGLYNESFIKTRLQEEIKRAILYQRPCSFIMFNIDNFEKFRNNQGELAGENALRKIANILYENLTQVGKAARFSDDEFAMLIPEKNKREARDLADAIRKKVEDAKIGGKASADRITVSGGVSENPLDGVTADELIEKARFYIRKSKEEGRNQVKAN